jgi:hypothetical protein
MLLAIIYCLTSYKGSKFLTYELVALSFLETLYLFIISKEFTFSIELFLDYNLLL